jgi:hypothetical protein
VLVGHQEPRHRAGTEIRLEVVDRCRVNDRRACVPVCVAAESEGAARPARRPRRRASPRPAPLRCRPLTWSRAAAQPRPVGLDAGRRAEAGVEDAVLALLVPAPTSAPALISTTRSRWWTAVGRRQHRLHLAHDGDVVVGGPVALDAPGAVWPPPQLP